MMTAVFRASGVAYTMLLPLCLIRLEAASGFAAAGWALWALVLWLAAPLCLLIEGDE